jgi:ribose 1,5-bisphosphate isomerase
MAFQQTLKDIQSLKIQGAQMIAREAVKALSDLSEQSSKLLKSSKDVSRFISLILKAKQQLFETRLTEPCMRNALDFVTAHLDAKKFESVDDAVCSIAVRSTEALAFLDDAEKKIAKYGSQKIKDGMIVFTHCHSHSVINILKAAWESGRHFEVHNTETRPRFQGRMTAIDLAKAGIPVTHYVDSAARFALKKADLMLIGADAITVEGKIINKVGSELFAEAAKRFSVPVYSCTTSWKFDPKTMFGFDEPIEKRNQSEIWDKPPKGVKIDNFAFEQVDPELLAGIITELGIFKSESLINQLEKKYPWMFKE